MEAFRGFTACLDNPKECDCIYGVGAWNISDIENTAAMNEVYDMGKSV